MATKAYLTYHDGKLEVPEEVQRDWRLHDGARLEVVYSSTAQIIIKPEEDKQSVPPSGDWRALRGLMADPKIDLNADLEAERLREIELDARWS